MDTLIVISQGLLLAIIIFCILIGLSILPLLNKLSDMSIKKRE